MCLCNLALGDVYGTAQFQIVFSPTGNMTVEHCPECRRCPGGCVHPVCDGVDCVIWKHLARHFAMLHRNPVHVPRKAQRDVSHVQQAIMRTSDSFDKLCPLTS